MGLFYWLAIVVGSVAAIYWLMRHRKVAAVQRRWGEFVSAANARLGTIECQANARRAGDPDCKNTHVRLSLQHVPYRKNFLGKWVGEATLVVTAIELTPHGEMPTCVEQFLLTFTLRDNGWEVSDGHWCRDIPANEMHLTCVFQALMLSHYCRKSFSRPNMFSLASQEQGGKSRISAIINVVGEDYCVKLVT